MKKAVFSGLISSLLSTLSLFITTFLALHNAFSNQPEDIGILSILLISLPGLIFGFALTLILIFRTFPFKILFLKGILFVIVSGIAYYAAFWTATYFNRDILIDYYWLGLLLAGALGSTILILGIKYILNFSLTDKIFLFLILAGSVLSLGFLTSPLIAFAIWQIGMMCLINSKIFTNTMLT